MSHSKKTVYFVRHGQSVDNASPVFQSLASPLSDKGQRQAAAIAERLAAIDFTTLIASPVPRAKETAGYIAGRTGKPIEFSELFVERIKPSEMDGKPWTDQTANRLWRDWEVSLYTPGKRVSDGENYDDTIKRADAALQFLTDRPESSLAVVTHGYFLRALVARVILGDQLTGPIMHRFQCLVAMENSGITVLEYRDAFEEEPTWRLWTHNDHSHFAE